MTSRVDLFNSTNVQKIQEYLDANPDIDLTKMVDEKGNTLLHTSSLGGKMSIMNIYI